jgi:cob(I)alamin adenosyltransferase
MKIYTKTGDDGTTGLFDGSRVAKSSIRVETYGTIDETNTFIGAAIAHNCPEQIKSDLENIQVRMMRLGTDLATPLESKVQFEINRIDNSDIIYLEELIDQYTKQLPALNNFILSGGTECASLLHVARAVCRRAERLAVDLESQDKINKHIVIFVNRLSDYLFTAARMANFSVGKDDITWKGR